MKGPIKRIFLLRLIIRDNMQNIINIYSEEKLDQILKNRSMLSSLYRNSINARQTVSMDAEPRNITKAIEKYMKKLIMSSNMQNDERLENYKSVLLSSIKQNPPYIYESEFLDLPKERLLGIMSEETYNQFSSYRRKVKKHCTNIYNRIMQKKEVTLEERHTLLDFLYSNIGTKNQEIYRMQETMIKNIMNEEREYDYSDANFLVSFIVKEEAKEYGYEILSNVVILPEEDKTVRGLANGYKIRINVEYALTSLNSKDKKDLANLVHTICHEVAHTKQYNDIIAGICNKNTLDVLTDKIFRQELSQEEFQYYKSNYYFESGEKDAEKVGFSHANKYIDKYLEDPIKKEKISNYLYNRKDREIYVDMISMRKDNTGKKWGADKFKIEKMGSILKRNNTYLKKYPIYRNIYNDNGELKTFEERLLLYSDFKKQNNEDSNNLFLSSFNYSVDNNDLMKIDFSNMSKKDLFKIMHSLFELYNTYSRMAHNALESIRQNDNFLNRENDIRNSNQYRDKKISIMASRYGKLERILDVFHDKLGEEYKTIEKYRHDEFLYNRDKNYARQKFEEIKKEREVEKIKREKAKEEIDKMLEEASGYSTGVSEESLKNKSNPK